MGSEEPVMAIEENDQTIVPSKLTEQAKVIAMPLLPSVSFTSLIYQWQPMGFRVRFDLPFISDDSGFLFLVRNGPYIPMWFMPVHKGGEGLNARVFHWNNTRPVLHHRDGGWTGLPVSSNPPLINKSISITQHDLPPIISTIAMSFRKWRGDMQYRFRIVAGFTTQGYLITTPIKNAHVPIGIYDEYSRCPSLLRLDTSYREGMANSYVPSDTSMFRHVEFTMPYEYPMPWYDQYHWLEQRTEVSEALIEGVKATKLVIEPCGDNFIGLGVRGAMESTKDKPSFVAVEIEYRCMEGFQFADPGIPPLSMLDSMQEVRYSNWTPDATWRRIKTVPSDEWESDGINAIKKRGSHQQESTLAKLTRLVNPPKPSTISDHGPQPEHSTVAPLYKQCRYDPRTKFTYCQDMQDKWHQWPGDLREKLSSSLVIKRTNRDTDIPEEPSHAREVEFMY